MPQSSRPPLFASRRETVVAAAGLAALVALAWWQRNVVDDAFIMLRYADHWARGHGLVWNPGERVEGYTNFLGTLAFGVALALGLEPVAFSHAFNLAFLALSLALFYDVARRVLGAPRHALVATALLGSNFTFSTSGTQGLGTHMQTAALLGCTAALLRLHERPAAGTAALLSLVAAGAVLVRMDSLLPLAFLGGAAAAMTLRAAGTPRLAAGRVAALVLPATVVVGGWLAWRWRFYGQLLPNTFYVKVASVDVSLAGLSYLHAFVLSYLLVPHLLVLGAALPRLRARADWPIALCSAIVAVWCAYVVRVGGDFIDFRFLAPVLPFLFLAIHWAALRVIGDRTLRRALLALLAAGSLHHARFFGRSVAAGPIIRPSLDIVSVPGPAVSHPILWSELETGRFLGDAFDHDPGVRVAIGAAGVIPFYSKLGFVDVMGLNDAWVARHGTPLRFSRFVGGLWPAHVRIATLAYLRERGVHLFVGAGALVRDDVAASIRTLPDLLTVMLAGEPDIARAFPIAPGELPTDALVVELPVRPGYRLLALYLTRTPRVDGVIAAKRWRSHPVARLTGA